jgi:hypothetical protein
MRGLRVLREIMVIRTLKVLEDKENVLKTHLTVFIVKIELFTHR